MFTVFFYWLVTHAVHFLVLPLYATLEVKGVENVPMEGPLIIASNHLNDVDPGVLATRIPRRLVFMTKVELFHVPVLSQFLTAFGAFPVRRNEADLGALRRSNETLKAGLALILFPEGRRSGVEAKMTQAWPGAALIALRNNTPVLPVAITGSQDLGMPGMFLRILKRRRVTLAIGVPFTLEQPARLNGATAAAGTDLIMRKIAALLPPEYRGYYGEDGPQPGAAAEEVRPDKETTT